MLDGFEHARFARLGESDRGAFATCATSSSDSMDIRIGRGRDVGCNEEVESSISKAAHHAVALFLRESAVNGFRAVTARVQGFGELVDFGACAAEHDR